MNGMKVSSRVIGAVCLGSIGFAFCLLMFLSPLFSDDWHYPLIFGTDQPITSLRDIFVSQYHHYFLQNGRFIPHFFVQLFDGLLGKGLFNIANTAVFIAFILLLLRVNDNKTEWSLLPVVLAILFLLMPGFNNAFLWLSGSCNYLWTAVLLLLFYRLLTRDSIKACYSPLLFLFGVVCGWTNEAMVVGFVAGCLSHYLFHRKELTMHRAVLLGGLVVGALLLIFAPGSIHRFTEGKEGGFSLAGAAHQLFSSLVAMDNLRILPLLLLILLGFAIFKKIPKGFFSDNLLWVVAVAVSVLFILFTGHQAAHSRFGIELFSLILILRLLGQVTLPRSLSVVCGVAVCVILAQTIYYSRLNYREYQQCVAQIEKTETGIIETEEVCCPAFFDRLILRFKPSEKSEYYYCQNDWIDGYFGKGTLWFLPRRFMERIRQDESAFEEFETNTDLPFYARRTEADSVRLALFHLSKPEAKDIPLLIRPFAGKQARYSAREVPTANLRVITLPQGRFVLVMKNHLIDPRVESITLQ